MSGEVAGEHEGFVAGLGGIEQDGFSVRDDAGRGRDATGEEAIGESGEEGFGFPRDHVFEMERVMGAGKNFGVAVVAADLFFELGLVFALVS